MFCSKCGKELGEGALFCSSCGEKTGEGAQSGSKAADSEQIARRVYENSRISAILWIVLGALQILCCVTIVAGVWNLVVGIRALQSVQEIRPNVPGVYDRFEKSLNSIIITAAINLTLGGVIGVALSALDYWTRELVLGHKEIFC